MKRTHLLSAAVALVALLLLSPSSLEAKVDIKNVNAETRIEKKQSNPDRDQVFVDVTYDLEGTVGDKGAVIAIDARLQGPGSSGAADPIRPLDSELEGDFGGVVGDGAKKVTWDATATLERLGLEGEWVCVIDVSAEGQGNAPTRAILTIDGYDEDAAHPHFSKGTVVMKDLEEIDKVMICAQTDRWESVVDADATFYQGEVQGFPSYRGRFPGDRFFGAVGDEHCSGFLAVKELGTANERVWANFTGEFEKTANVNGTSITANYIFQIRYNRIRNGSTLKEFIKVGNAGKPGQEGSFNEAPAIVEYNVHIDVGKEDVESSHGFDLEVKLYEFEYRYGGAPTLRFEGIEGSYFKSDGGTELTLEGSRMKVNNWLMYDGPARIDSTPDNGTLLVTGEFSSPQGKTIWHSSSKASLTEGFDIDAVDGDAWGLDPEQVLAPEWPFSTRNVEFIGGLDATGIKTDMLLVIPWLNSGCNEKKSGGKIVPGGFAVGGLEIEDLEYSNDGFDFKRMEAENIGLAAIGEFCMRSLVLQYDKEEKRVDIDGDVVFKKWFDNAKFGISVIDWLPERLELSVKLGADDAVDIPYPQPSPLHVAEWRGLGVKADNIVTGPFHLAGTGIIGSNKEWAKIPGYEQIAKVAGDAELFELKPTISYTYPLLMGLKGDIKVIGYKNSWLTNGRKIWLAQGILETKAGISTSGLTASGSGTIRVLDYGGDHPMLEGTASAALTLGSSFDFSLVMTADARIPTFFTDLPLGDYLNHKLGLPIVLAQAHAEVHNTAMTFAKKSLTDEECYVINLAYNPVTEKDRFFRYCDAAAVINSRTTRKDVSPAGANDTTWFTFSSTPDMRLAVAQVWSSESASSVLRSPSGLLVADDATVPDITFSPSKSEGMSDLWEITNPEMGVWSVGIVGYSDGDSLATWGRYRAVPELEFDVQQSGKIVSTSWTPGARSDDAEVRFYLDFDGEGYNGEYIGSAADSEGGFSFSLSDSLTECGYYIYGRRIDDGFISSSYDRENSLLQVEKDWLDAPTNVAAVVSHITGEVSVSWEHSTDTNRSGYAVIVTDSEGRDSVYRTVDYGFTLSTFEIEDWQSKTLSVVTLNLEGYSGCRSEPVSFSVTSVDDSQSREPSTGPDLTVHMRPNPATESVRLLVNIEETDVLAVDLYDLEGQKIRTIAVAEYGVGTADLPIDIDGLPSGTYVLRVTTLLNGTATERLVIRR